VWARYITREDGSSSLSTVHYTRETEKYSKNSRGKKAKQEKKDKKKSWLALDFKTKMGWIYSAPC
jgi:hypothetical protein